MDWTAFAIGAIPSVLAVVTVIIQVFRDRKKDEATADKTRAEALLAKANAADTIAAATDKIVAQYDRIALAAEKDHERAIALLAKEYATEIRILNKELARVKKLHANCLRMHGEPCDEET